MHLHKKVIVTIQINQTEKRTYKYVSDLLSFTAFVDREFPDWRFMNVYEYKKDFSGKQIANYTKKNRPQYRKLTY